MKNAVYFPRCVYACVYQQHTDTFLKVNYNFPSLTSFVILKISGVVGYNICVYNDDQNIVEGFRRIGIRALRIFRFRPRDSVKWEYCRISGTTPSCCLRNCCSWRPTCAPLLRRVWHTFFRRNQLVQIRLCIEINLILLVDIYLFLFIYIETN